MKTKILTLAISLLFVIKLWGENDFKYQADYWADIKGKGFANAIENPNRESVEVTKKGNFIRVTLGKNTFQYTLSKVADFSAVRKDFHVKNSGGVNRIISISKIPSGKTVISIEKIWMIPDAKLISNEGKQYKKVLVTQVAKTVPTGKKWVLMFNKKFKAELSSYVLNNGSRCNALFFSNPQMLDGVNYIRNGVERGYYIIFDSYKETLGSDDVYEFNPTGFLSKEHSVSEYYLAEPFMMEFKAGDEVFVTNCVEGIELIELDAK